MNLMMPSAVESAEGIYRRRQHLVLVAELYKNNIMNALQQA
jgi:hypothetical protein